MVAKAKSGDTSAVEAVYFWGPSLIFSGRSSARPCRQVPRGYKASPKVKDVILLPQTADFFLPGLVLSEGIRTGHEQKWESRIETQNLFGGIEPIHSGRAIFVGHDDAADNRVRPGCPNDFDCLQATKGLKCIEAKCLENR